MSSMAACEEDGRKKKEEVAAEHAEAALKRDEAAKNKETAFAKLERSRGRTRTLFFFVRLVQNFVLVLMIGVLTDLVVFPLLLTYRFAHILKHKIRRLLGRGGCEKKSNGTILEDTNHNRTG